MTTDPPPFGERPIHEVFPGAVHNPLTCPACAIIRVAHKIAEPKPKWICPDCGTHAPTHRFAPLGPRRGYLWTLGADGKVKICVPSIVVDSPPRQRA